MAYKNGRYGKEKGENIRQRDAHPDENVVIGRNAVKELLASDSGIEKLYITSGEREGSINLLVGIASERKIPIIELDRQKLDRMCGNARHQGIIAAPSEQNYSSVEEILAYAEEKGEPPFIVLLDGVEDPHNLGAIIRCADGAGAHGVIISKRHAPIIGQTVFKSSAGAAEHVAIAKVANIASAVEELKELGVWTFAAEAGGTSYRDTDFDCAAAIVMGSEGDGVSRLVREKCDFTVSIPMRGKVNSLNVSTAAAVLLFEAADKQHRT